MTDDGTRRIRVGVGGWTYQPWRGAFYPEGLKHAEELSYASRALTTIEINGTYYRTQTPATFRKWYDETPDDFVFSIKAPRYIMSRRDLAEAAPAIERFLGSGILELKQKLGPINWQFLPTRSFQPEEFDGFLALLPRTVDGHTLRHAVEVRHPSFQSPDFVTLARAQGVAIVVAGDSEYPRIVDITAPFVYVRIMGTREEAAAGYPEAALAQWANRARRWAAGGVPDDLALLCPAAAGTSGRDVFLYVISGYKQRNPAAAMALIERLGR